MTNSSLKFFSSLPRIFPLSSLITFIFLSLEEFIQFKNEWQSMPGLTSELSSWWEQQCPARISSKLAAYSNTLIGAIKGYLVILDKKQLRVEWEERGVSEMMSSPSLGGYLAAGLSQNMLVRRYKYKELFTFIFNIYLTCWNSPLSFYSISRPPRPTQTPHHLPYWRKWTRELRSLSPPGLYLQSFSGT